jgi:hypothetical protein
MGHVLIVGSVADLGQAISSLPRLFKLARAWTE